MGRFESSHDPLVLLAVAADVLRAARPEAPDTVAQQAYDDAREQAGHAASPRAFRLARRFGVSWSVLREQALHAQDPARMLAIAGKQQRRRVLTRAEAASALRRVADLLGSEELTTAAYNEGRVVLNQRAAARHAHGRHIIPLPEANTIVRKFSWPDIARAAGLRIPAVYAPACLPRDEAICVFVETFGFMPRRDDINWMGKAYGIQFVKEQDDQHRPAAQEAKERFHGEGRWFPPVKTRGIVRPQDWQQLGVGSPALDALARACPRQRAVDEGYTIEEVRAVLKQAWDALPRGERLTVEQYGRLYKARGWPHYFTINKLAKRHETTFVKLVQDEAAARSKRR